MNTDELQDNPDKNKAKFQDSTESDAQEEILAFAVDANSGLATVGPADRTTMKGKAEYVIGIGPAEDSFGRVRVKDKAAGTKVTVEGAAFKLVEDSECIIELTTDSFRPVKVRIKGTTDRGRRVNLSIPR